MNFGTKFRLSDKVSLKRALAVFNSDINNFIEKQSFSSIYL